MNKLYNYALGVLSLLTITVSSANAQSCDTLRNYDATQGLSIITGVEGFVPGHEIITPDEVLFWAEPFTVATSTNVVSFRFAVDIVDDAGGSITLNIWNEVAGNPGTVIATETINLADIDAGFFNTFEFATPVNIPAGNFYAGFGMEYSNFPANQISIISQQVTTGTLKMFDNNGGWQDASAVYTLGNPPLSAQLSTALDVLTTNGTVPTPDFTILPATGEICASGSFQVDGSLTTGDVDAYNWALADNPFTQIYVEETGQTATISPTVSPSTQAIYLLADGACVTEVVGYLVDVYDDVSASVGTTSPTCGNNNGVINVTAAAGGDGTYTYELTDGGGNTTTQGNGSFTALAPGTYDLSVTTSGGGCEFTQQVTLTAIPPETITAAADETICNGASVNLTATGTGSIQWFDGGGNLVGSGSPLSVSPTTTTTYDAVLTDANGCTDTDQLQVTVNPVNDATFTYSSNTICLGGANEVPTINGTGTFTSTPAGLVFADASTGEIDIAGSTANTYDVTFTTTGTCGEVETQTITLTTAPDASFSYGATEYCAEVGVESPTFPSGASAGTFTATPAGLSLNGTNGEITLDASTGNTYTITNTIPASGSCSIATATTTVTINALPAVDGGGDENVCEGTQITLTATGADTYSWTGSITQGTAFTPSLGNTTYTVSGTDANGCENTDDVVVTVDEEPVLDAGADLEVCDGEEVTLTATNSVGTVTWNNSVTDGTPFTPTATATYTATATNGACSVTDDLLVTVNALPSVVAGADQTTCENYDPITLSGTPAGGTFSGAGVTGAEFDPGTAGVGTHVVTYTYQDGNGCESSATQTFTVDGCASIEENALEAIVVAPNPATSHVNIKINSNDLRNVQLMSATGQLIDAEVVIEAAQTRVDLNKVSKGTYFLQINTINGQTTKKLIVQ